MHIPRYIAHLGALIHVDCSSLDQPLLPSFPTSLVPRGLNKNTISRRVCFLHERFPQVPNPVLDYCCRSSPAVLDCSRRALHHCAVEGFTTPTTSCLDRSLARGQHPGRAGQRHNRRGNHAAAGLSSLVYSNVADISGNGVLGSVRTPLAAHRAARSFVCGNNSGRADVSGRHRTSDPA